MKRPSRSPTTLAAVLPLLALGVLLLRPADGAAQRLTLGARVSVTGADETSVGAGLQVTAGLPLVGLRVQASGDQFWASCGEVECDFRDYGINLLLSLPLPVIDPWLGAGLAIIDRTGVAGDDRDVGAGLLAGVGFRRVFAEAKLLLVGGLDGRAVLTGGVLLPIL